MISTWPVYELHRLRLSDDVVTVELEERRTGFRVAEGPKFSVCFKNYIRSNDSSKLII